MKEERKNRIRRILILLVVILLALALIAVAVWAGYQYYLIQRAHTPAVEYDPGAWIEIAPEGAVTGTGEQLVTQMRMGSEHKVIVFFYGGGISVDEYTAARPYLGLSVDREPGFYADSTEGYIPDFCELGLGSRQPENPFRDWTLLVVPYTTGDFHLGTGETAYTAPDGTEKVLYQHGYTDYRLVLDEAMEYLDSDPEELLIAGWSAGGYAAAILAEEIMTDFFPKAGHVTVCVDSSLLLLDDFAEIMRDVWRTPEEIADRVRSSNLVVDFLTDLYEEHGDSVTYLYIGSARDGALARYQNYFDVGDFTVSNESVGMYQVFLREMVAQLRENIPSVGIYLFDRMPYSWLPWMSRLTQHTILETQGAFWDITAGRSAIDWLWDAVEGRTEVLGLGLLLR